MAFPDLTAIYLGLGVNRVTTRLENQGMPGLNRAVEGLIVEGSVRGQSHYSICRTASDLAQAMQQQSGGSLTGLGFLPLLNAKRKFYQSLKSTTFSLTVLVHSRCITSSGTLLEPHLLPGINVDSLDEFANSYGDSFINSVNLGGEFLAAYTFRTETNEQMRSVENELQAGGMVMALGTPLNVGVSLGNLVNEAQKKSKVSVDLNYQVWGARTPNLQANEIINYALSFGSSAIEQPALLDITALGYEHIADLGSAFRPVAKNRELFISENGLLHQRMLIEELSNQIEDTRAGLHLYGIHLADEQELSAVHQQVEVDRQAYKELENAYTASASTPLSIPDFSSLAVGSPQISASVVEDSTTTVGQSATSLGTPFFFPYSLKTAIQNRVRLSRLALETGRQLDKLTLHYQSRTEQQERIEVHGGTRGNLSGDVELAAGEGVNEIYSEFGTHLDKILLKTDRGTLGGGGNQGDRLHPMSWQRGPQEVLIGFSGRADDKPEGAVYTLSAIIARFEGIHWEKFD
jgi:hypothetical protein